MTDIKDLFRELGHQLGAAIGESMIQTVRQQLPRLREELGGLPAGSTGASPLSSPSFASTLSRRPAPSSTRGAKVSAALTRPCPVPGCTRPGRGPRFSFLCDVHREMPPSEREKYRIRPRRE